MLSLIKDSGCQSFNVFDEIVRNCKVNQNDSKFIILFFPELRMNPWLQATRRYVDDRKGKAFLSQVKS